MMDTYPLISVIMPIRNESAYIIQSLGAVLKQDYPSEKMEVLIADGMSTDDTRLKILHLTKRNPMISINISDNPQKIVPTSINIALRQAKGEIIIRVDGHTIIAPDYVCQCVEEIERTGADNVGGGMNAVGKTYFGNAVALATSTPFGIGGGRFHYSDKEEWVDTVYMGAWPRRVFEKIGLFDEELVRDQDDEFNFRLRAAGGEILLSPKIKSEYTVRSSPKALWRQYYQYGYWKVRVLQKHPRQMSLRQFVPPVFVLALFGSLFFALLPTTRFLSPLIPLLYLLANFGASVITASKRGWQYLPLLPVTFGILHLSYGFGFLAGLFKFWNRWGDKKGKVPFWGNVEVSVPD
jgi:succinoglycan biosynthesis protein ExoA